MIDSILLVGCGKMGGALLSGWIKQNIARNIIVIDHHKHEENAVDNVRYFKSLSDCPLDFTPTLIVFAVKPKDLAGTLPHYKRFKDTSLFLSAASGKAISFYEGYLGKGAAIVRFMPNTPVSVGQGVSIAFANLSVGEEQKSQVEALLQAGGLFFFIQKEELMHAVTAISGSGPAYIFYLIECLSRIGVDCGLGLEQAKQLGMQTILGAVTLAKQSPLDPSVLRENVTSPQGTTHAGLKVLMDAKQGLEPVMKKTVLAALNRSKEMAL